MNDPTAKLNAFLSIYFFQLEYLLNSNTTSLENIKFQSEEANTDEFIKLFFKDYIKTNNSISIKDIHNINLNYLGEVLTYQIKDLKHFFISNVFLPSELSNERKKLISKSKKSVYTNPDLLLQIEDGNEIYFISVELKSTKNNNIPGSSVQQISPFEWVIFIKRNNENIEISTGHYINSITEKLPFPDRSPRPQIGFNTLSNWNKENRVYRENTLTITNDENIVSQKIKLLNDWQDFLASEWLDIISSDADLKNNEKWFNNTIRKFAIKFLEYSENMSLNDRELLKSKLNNLIKK